MPQDIRIVREDHTPLDIQPSGQIPIFIEGETGNRAVVDVNGKVLSDVGLNYNVDDEALVTDAPANVKLSANGVKLDSIVGALGGAVTAADPVGFTNIQDVAKNVPVGHKTLSAAVEVELVHEIVPAGKRWYITAWDGSGRKEGEYSLILLNTQYASSDTIEDFEDVSDWTPSEGTFDESTTQTKAGTYSGKWDSFSSNQWVQNTTKYVEKIYGSPQDWSGYRYISYWIYDNTGGDFETWLRLEETSPAGNYTFAAVSTAIGGWKRLIFDLKEASDSGLDLTDIEHIRISCKNVGATVTGPEFYIDDMIYKTVGIESMKSRFFLSADTPYNHLFPTPIIFEAGEELIMRVKNLGAQAAAFEVGVNGREVTI